MKCSYHPETEAVGICVNCGRAVCGECQVLLKETSYCKYCLENLVPGRERLIAVSSIAHKKYNWFQRHLHWTLIIVWIAIYPILFAFGLFLGFTGLYYSMSELAFNLTWTALSLIIYFGITAWVLHRKKRNLIWLLMGFIPFGWIAFFTLSNMRETYGQEYQLFEPTINRQIDNNGVERDINRY